MRSYLKYSYFDCSKEIALSSGLSDFVILFDKLFSILQEICYFSHWKGYWLSSKCFKYKFGIKKEKTFILSLNYAKFINYTCFTPFVLILTATQLKNSKNNLSAANEQSAKRIKNKLNTHTHSIENLQIGRIY